MRQAFGLTFLKIAQPVVPVHTVDKKLTSKKAPGSNLPSAHKPLIIYFTGRHFRGLDAGV
jgi:hypothetical protein